MNYGIFLLTAVGAYLLFFPTQRPPAWVLVAYGVGLALTLTAAGFAVVRLGTGVTRVLDRRPRWTAHPVTTFLRRTAPLASALLVVLLGAGLVFKGAASVLG